MLQARAALIVCLLLPHAAAFEHYPSRDSAPSYFSSSCPSERPFIVDDAQVFSQRYGPAIERLACALDQNNSAEFVIATFTTIARDPLPVYAQGLYHAWNIGDVRESGALLVYVEIYGNSQQPAVWLHVGPGLSGALSNVERDRAYESARADYDQGLAQGLSRQNATEVALANAATLLMQAITEAHSEGGYPPIVRRTEAPAAFWMATAAFIFITASMGVAAITLDMRRRA